MNFQSLWLVVLKQNKKLSDSGDTITMSKYNFRRALELAFNKGMECERDNRNKATDTSFFDNLFGKF